MKVLLVVCFAIFLSGCNSSGKKDPNKEMDDTARMDNPPVLTSKVEPQKGAASDIPASIKVKGTVQEVWKWKDNAGENLLITTYVAPYDDTEKNKFGEEGQTAELHAFHYAKQGTGEYAQVWMMNDQEKSCPFDITCQFVPGSTTITDLDNNGIAEIKIQYLITCRSDVSPAAIKLIMYENGKKYALRGNSWIPYSPDFKFDVTEDNANLEKMLKAKDETEEMLRSFGRYETEKEFNNAPPEFIIHARKEWLKYVKEKMGE